MRHLLFILLLAFGSVVTISPLAAQTEEPVVHAVLFWMEGCGHCDWVKQYTLPPLQTQYGDQLDIHLVELKTSEEFEQLYKIAAALGVPQSSWGVPFLLIGDAALIGSVQIPTELPGLVEMHLAVGGAAYPTVPGLDAFLPREEICVAGTPCPGAARFVQIIPPTAESAAAPLTTNGLTEEAAAAPIHSGFALAVVILLGMVGAVGYAIWYLVRPHRAVPLAQPPMWRQVALPILALIGLGVAAYLAYVETQAVSAICGPIGDCNTVQTSEYAYLFGIPIGVVGVVGYLAILFTWWWGQWQKNRSVSLILLGITGFGVLFSIYLTYLEPFVIGAVCAWCLASAVIMTVLMLLVLEPAVREMRLIGDSAAGHTL